MGFSTAQGIMDALASPNIDPVDIAWEIDSDLRVRKPNAGEMRMRFTQEWVTPEVRWSIRRFYRLCRTRRAVENYLTYTRKEARRLAWEMFFTLGRSLMQRTWRPMRTQTEPIATVTPIRRYEQPNPHASWCTHCGKARWLHRETDGYACPAIGTAMDRWTPTGAAVARLTETEPAKPIETSADAARR
jgi:hypothetical protein